MIGTTDRSRLPTHSRKAESAAASDARQPGTGDARRVGLASLGQLLDLPVNHLARVPIEVSNLLCATALPDTHKLDIPACLATLGEMTRAVLHETRRHAYRYRQNPAEFDGREGVYRMIVLVTVVQEDFGVRYDAEAVARKTYEKSGEGFLHSLLDPRKGERNGTCANMPVLYAAIARRLGDSATRSTSSAATATCSAGGTTRRPASGSTSRAAAGASPRSTTSTTWASRTRSSRSTCTRACS